MISDITLAHGEILRACNRLCYRAGRMVQQLEVIKQSELELGNGKVFTTVVIA